jgi:hypothetical protein
MAKKKSKSEEDPEGIEAEVYWFSLTLSFDKLELAT